MAARGLLMNPALFSGYEATPAECIADWINLVSNYGGVNASIFHRHIMYMTYAITSKFEKKELYNIASMPGISQYFEDKLGYGLLESCQPDTWIHDKPAYYVTNT
eukprot:TRINITY_DN27808_c0_g1_i1.p1 TRINITY_DN27808_c0_g1~~TRINITY_DN27808_c0_g1_i1.p1  ORF type:complete len:114 (+),score=24.75 TRINITY_DN27808_c0_g1_i1:30-344(+)